MYQKKRIVRKRIDAYVPTIKRSSIINAIIKTGADGVTVIESRGRGTGERPMIEGGRGTTRYIAEYNRTDYITAIVDDSKVDKVIKTIIDTAYTGSKGDGKIFVYAVEESYDIGNRKKIS